MIVLTTQAYAGSSSPLIVGRSLRTVTGALHIATLLVWQNSQSSTASGLELCDKVDRRRRKF